MARSQVAMLVVLLVAETAYLGRVIPREFGRLREELVQRFDPRFHAHESRLDRLG